MPPRERDATRRAVAPRARRRTGRVPRRPPRVRPRRLPALRRPALHGRLPDDGDEKARRRHRHDRLRPLHRLRVLRGGLPLPGALQDARAPRSPTTARWRTRRSATTIRARAVATKCTFCVDRIDEGLANGLKPGVDPEATPACVNACITQALSFGDLDDPQSNVSRLVARESAFPHARGARHRARLLLPLGREREPARARMTYPSQGYGAYGPDPWHQSSWDARAAGNFICGGMGGGLIVFTVLSGASGAARSRASARRACARRPRPLLRVAGARPSAARAERLPQSAHVVDGARGMDLRAARSRVPRRRGRHRGDAVARAAASRCCSSIARRACCRPRKAFRHGASRCSCR